MAGDCSFGSCTRARRSSDKCPSLIRRPPKKWIAAEVRCLSPTAERAAFTLRRKAGRARLKTCARSHRLPHRPVVTVDILSDEYIDRRLYADLGFLRGASAFLPSEAEIVRIWGPPDIGAWLRETASRLKCHMVAKLGERGSLVCDAESGVLIHTPAHPVKSSIRQAPAMAIAEGSSRVSRPAGRSRNALRWEPCPRPILSKRAEHSKQNGRAAAARQARLQQVLTETRYEKP